MPIDTEAVAKLLRDKYGLRASYEHPGYIHVTQDRHTFCAGTANGTWDVDVYQGDLNDDMKVEEWSWRFSSELLATPAWGFGMAYTPSAEQAANWTSTKIHEYLGRLREGI